MELNGKTALITGGTTGIGFATAKLFKEHGARIAITGQDTSRLEAARLALGDSTAALQADVRSPLDLSRVHAALADTFRHLDVLFANAGVAFATPIASTTEERFDTLMDTNVRGVFLTVQAMLPLMHSGGSIVLNTSWLAEVGTGSLSALSASKAAVRSFARTLSAELLPRGIRVNAVSPGAINTPIHAKTGMNPEEFAAFAEHMQKAIPLGRFGQPRLNREVKRRTNVVAIFPNEDAIDASSARCCSNKTTNGRSAAAT